MSSDALSRAVAAFSALTLASLLTTSVAIAATGGGFKPALSAPAAAAQVTPLQTKAAHVAKARAAVAIYTGRRF